MPKPKLDKKVLKKLVKARLGQVGGQAAKMPEKSIEELVDMIADKPEMLRKKGAFARAVNLFVKGYNKVRFKKVPADKKNEARGKEKHQPLLLPNKSMTVARFSGPGTELVRRIKELVKQKKPVRGLTPVDDVALLHDINYAKAKDVNDIRKADVLMAKRVAKIAAKKQDNKYNTVGGIAIAGKIALEAAGALARDKFAEFKKLDANEKALLDKVEKDVQPSKLGYGKKKKGPNNAWTKHLGAFRKANPQLSLKEAMKGASKTYRK